MCMMAWGTQSALADDYSKATEKQRKEAHKTAEKEAKKQAKKLEKEGWQYSGPTSLVYSLTDMIERSMLSDGLKENHTFDINNAPSLRNGETSLTSLAQSEFAQTYEAILIGKIQAHTGDADMVIGDITTSISSQFKGDVKKVFTLYRRTVNGKFDMRGYFIFDMDAANKRIASLTSDEEIAKTIEKLSGSKQ